MLTISLSGTEPFPEIFGNTLVKTYRSSPEENEAGDGYDIYIHQLHLPENNTLEISVLNWHQKHDDPALQDEIEFFWYDENHSRINVNDQFQKDEEGVYHPKSYLIRSPTITRGRHGYITPGVYFDFNKINYIIDHFDGYYSLLHVTREVDGEVFHIPLPLVFDGVCKKAHVDTLCECFYKERNESTFHSGYFKEYPEGYVDKNEAEKKRIINLFRNDIVPSGYDFKVLM
jgi:hypothetical protein